MDERLERVGGTLAVYALFSILYPLAQSAASGSRSLAIGLDAAIPFIPGFILFYHLGYILPALPAFVLRERREIRAALAAFAGVLFVSVAVFLLFPAVVERPPLAGEGVFARILAFQYAVDAPYNTFPSLHVSLASLGYLIVLSTRRSLGAMLLPAYLAVLVSPLFVKQHYIMDVVGGLLLAGVGFFAYRQLASAPLRRFSRTSSLPRRSAKITIQKRDGR
jgi:membrane-associated phospholipid phosphatase